MTQSQNCILLHRCAVSAGGNSQTLSTERYGITWRGFVYIDGVASGAASIRRFAKEIGSDLAKAAGRLKGVYFVAVEDKFSKRSFAFVDNSGLYHAYYSRHCVGTSFLNIASFENLGTDDLDPETVVEFLQFGCIYDGRTFFPQIRKIDADTIVESLSDGSTATFTKCLADISEQPQRNLEECLQGLAGSIASETISLDLTGGIDSRLLAAALSYFGVPFEVAASGSPEIEDVQIAQEVAEALGRDFFRTAHEPADTNWNELFVLSDGLFDLAKSDRPMQLQRDRAARGISLAISGAGGELFKDFWWLQDFPFYNRQRPDLQRLYATRFAPGPPSVGVFSGKYRAAAARTLDRILTAMGKLSVPGNTRTYDRIYYELKMREFAGRFLTNTSAVLPVHAPFLEREAVAIGYNLRRSERFFNRFHRSLITKYSPKVAEIRTTEGGMTVSASPLSMCSDMGKYVSNRVSRLKAKLNQRRGLRSEARPGPDNPQLDDVLSEVARTRKTFQRLQDYGILDNQPSNTHSRVSSGSLIAFDILIERLESNWTAYLPAKSSIPQAV